MALIQAVVSKTLRLYYKIFFCLLNIYQPLDITMSRDKWCASISLWGSIQWNNSHSSSSSGSVGSPQRSPPSTRYWNLAGTMKLFGYKLLLFWHPRLDGKMLPSHKQNLPPYHGYLTRPPFGILWMGDWVFWIPWLFVNPLYSLNVEGYQSRLFWGVSHLCPNLIAIGLHSNVVGGSFAINTS